MFDAKSLKSVVNLEAPVSIGVMFESNKTRDITKRVSHQQAGQLLHNKFIVVLGDSIQRSVYKDIVLLLQKEKYLTTQQLKSKGEMSFEMDCLIEGGCLNQMHNGTEYREVRQYQSAHHLVRFYFVTRIYSHYMQSILEDFRVGLKPDVVIVNSCVWDISRYSSIWVDDYKENMRMFFDKMNKVLPEETLVIWGLTMPLAEKIKGGFLVPEIEHKVPQLRYDVIEANFYSASLADAYGMDVLDLHYQFRFSLEHRTKDGVHWNALAHRRMTSLLLQHAARAWGVIMPCPMKAANLAEIAVGQQGNASNPQERHPPRRTYKGNREEIFSDSLPSKYLSVKYNEPQRQSNHHQGAGASRRVLPTPPHPPVHRHRPCKHGQVVKGFDYRPPHHFEPYIGPHHQYVMRSRHSRHHYAPYTHYRPHQYACNGPYY